MSSGGKGGSGQKSYNYFGSLAGVVRAGQVDILHAILSDGKAFWEGPITESGHGNPYSLSITDPKWLHGTGDAAYVRFFWGKESQTTADVMLAGHPLMEPDEEDELVEVAEHPPYRGLAYIVYRRFLFGKERTSAPNAEIIATAFARPPTSAISTTGLHNDSCNPFAILAELLTSVHGASLDVSALNAQSWQDAHDFFAATSARRDATYCSPMLDAQQELRAVATSILQLCDGWLRFDVEGKIEAGFFNPDPGDLEDYTIITANDLVEPPKLKTETWDKVPTGVVYTFTERDRNWKQTSDKVDSLMALRAAVQPRRERLDLSHVLNRQQAQTIAAEWVKRYCRPQMSGNIVVRSEKARWGDGSPLRPGDRFLLDVDPEPGGAASLQLCRVLERRFGMKGPVTLRVEAEANQPAIPYTPAYTPPNVEEITVANIVNARIIAAPPDVSPEGPAIWALASRPDDLVNAAGVEFDIDGGSGTFAEIGRQIGFAVRCVVDTAYEPLSFSAEEDGPIRIHILDTRDQHLALQDLGASAAENDELLLVILNDDVDGFVDMDGDTGLPILEIFSIETYEALGDDRYDFTVLRGRMGTASYEWEDGSEAWIIPRASLVNLQHLKFPGYVQTGEDLVFHLRSANKWAEYEPGDPLVDFPFRFPTGYNRASVIAWTMPDENPFTLVSDDLTPAATITDADSNLTKLELVSIRQDSGQQTVHLNVTFPPTASMTLAAAFDLAGLTGSLPLSFPGDPSDDIYYTLTLRATDTFGTVVQSSINMVNLASGGGGSGNPLPPVVDIEAVSGGDRFLTVITVEEDVQIHYKVTNRYEITPPGSYSIEFSTTKTLLIKGYVRLWVRASDGTHNSAWIFFDFLPHSH